MNDCKSLLLLIPLIFHGILQFADGSATSVNVGRTYVVPAPADLPNLVDYTNMTQQCSQNTSSANCVYAMTQFISDLNLMLPDTQTFITNLQQQITNDQTEAQYKSTQIQNLIATVSALSAQLIQNSAALDSADDAYYSRLGSLQSLVAETVNQQTSPVYAMASAEAASMNERQMALQAAVTSYLTQERKAITDTGNYVFQLFKNDQGIIQSNAANQMKTISSQAGNLTNTINQIRTYFQNNLTAMTAALNSENQQIATAETSADSSLAQAEQTISGTIQSGINSAMTATGVLLQNQINNVSNLIDSIRTNSYSQFDQAFSQVSAQDANATAVIDANISTAQAGISTLSNLVTVNVQAAQAAQQNAIKNLNGTQSSQQTRLAQNSQALKQAIADYTAKASSVTSSVFGSSQTFMSQFAALAQNAASQAGGSMVGSATSTGDSMSSLNSYIGSMSGSAYAQSQGAAADMAGSLSNARQSAAMTSVAQIKALSDAINTITALVRLLKNKMGYSSAQNGVQISSVEQLLTESTSQLQSTINAVSQSVSNEAYAAAQSAQSQLNQAAAIAASGKQTVLTQFSKALDSLQTKISNVAVSRTNAATAGQNAASSLSSLASQLANSNANLASKVAALLGNINASWDQVTRTNANLSNAVNASLSQLTNAATVLANNQTASSLNYIAAQLENFKALVNQTQASALRAQAEAVGTANSTMQGLAARMNETLGNTNQVVNSTMSVANATLVTIKAIPALLTQMASNSSGQISLAASNSRSAIKTRVDQVQTNLLSQIRNGTSAYLQNSYSQLLPVKTAIENLVAQLQYAQRLQKAVFPDGVDVLNMNASEFGATLQRASNSVANASSSLGTTYADLAKNLSSTYLELSSAISAVSQRLSLLEPNVSQTVSSALQEAQSNLTATSDSFASFGRDLVNRVIAEGSAQTGMETNLTSQDLAVFNNLMTAAQTQTSLVMEQVAKATSSQQAEQTAVSEALDTIVKTLSSISSGNSALLLNIKSQFMNLQSSTNGFTDTMNRSLGDALESASSSAARAEGDAQKNISNTASQSAADMTDLADRLRTALAVLNTGSASDMQALKESDAQAMQLAETVAGLGLNTSARIQEVLSKILSGQTSVSDVLNASASMQIADLTSVESLMVAFTQSINHFITQTSQMYQDQEVKLDAFNSTVPGVLAKYQLARLVGLGAAQSVLSEASTTAKDYNDTEQSLIHDTSSAIELANYQLGNMTVSIPSQLAAIKQAIQNAVLTVEESQDAVGASLLKATQTAKATVVGNIRNFRTQKNMPSYALAVEEVALPTSAPLITVNL